MTRSNSAATGRHGRPRLISSTRGKSPRVPRGEQHRRLGSAAGRRGGGPRRPRLVRNERSVQAGPEQFVQCRELAAIVAEHQRRVARRVGLVDQAADQVQPGGSGGPSASRSRPAARPWRRFPARRRPRSAAGAADQEVGEQRHRPARAALLRAADVGGAGDVEVRPLQPVGELGEEGRRRDRAAVAAGDVREIGEIALQLLAVFLGQRQAPGAIVGAQAAVDELGRRARRRWTSPPCGARRARSRRRPSAWRRRPPPRARSGARSAARRRGSGGPRHRC
jgi:hypothetical protein